MIIEGEVIQAGTNHEWECETLTVRVSKEDLKNLSDSPIYKQVIIHSKKEEL